MTKEINKNHSGYTLSDIGNNKYQLKWGNNTISGSLFSIIKYMTQRLDFHVNDVENAVFEMEINFHTTAVFGIMKTFMYTEDQLFYKEC